MIVAMKLNLDCFTKFMSAAARDTSKRVVINQSHLVLIDLAQSCNKNSNPNRDLVGGGREREGETKHLLDFQRLCKNLRTATICLHTEQAQIPHRRASGLVRLLLMVVMKLISSIYVKIKLFQCFFLLRRIYK